MGILFDSRDALLGGPVVQVIRLFDVLRDHVGHTTKDNDIDVPEDFDFFAPGDTAHAFIPGPYDINNGIDYISGAEHLDGDQALTGNSSDPIIELGCWVKLDDVPVPGVEFEQSFLKVTNIGNGEWLQQFFLLKTDGTIQLRCKFFNGGSTFTSTHPDNMDRTNWTFFVVRFDHTASAGADTIYMDPGNDNLLGFDPGPNLNGNNYDIIEITKDSFQSPGDVKEIKFSNLLLIRETPPDTGEQNVVFTTPGMSTFTVPTGITSLTSTQWSGGGGGGGGGSVSIGGDGGGSGFTKGTHTVIPGADLEVWVGAGGGSGDGAPSAGQGGGSAATSSLWTESQVMLFQATGGGAGGGAGDNSAPADPGGQGGPGGGTTGVDGSPSGTALPGIGGNQSVGGAGGVGNNTGEDGAFFQGGRGANGVTGLGGANNGAPVNGAAGGDFSVSPAGFGGGGGGAAGYYGGGGGGSSISGGDGGAGGGGGSGFMDAGATSTTNSQGSGTTPAGTGDALYVVPVGEGGDGGALEGNGQSGADGRQILTYGSGPSASWRATVRGFSTQSDFDTFVIESIKPTRFWRTSEYDLGSGRGDRFIHEITGFLNRGFAPNGTLTRNVASGPLDVSKSYEYEAGCVAQTSIFYTTITSWALTWFTFFRQPTTPSSDNDWFIRFENDANEYIQIERNGNDVTFRAQFSDLSQHVFTDVGSSLLDGSWHRLVMAANTTATGWIFGIDGVNVMGQPSAVLALSAPFKRILWGNIDVNLAVMGWANYLDPDILTTFTTVTTELGVRQYIEARTDASPGGTDYYGGYYPQQDPEVGSVPP